MTTIATDGHSMAADSMTSAGNEVVAFGPKVLRTPDGRIFATSGSAADGEMFARWMLDEREKPTLGDDFAALVLSTGGKVFYLCDKLEPVEYMVPQALGSGADFAIGAMLAGATPEEAVRIACQRDVWSGGNVTSLCLHEAPSLKEVA